MEYKRAILENRRPDPCRIEASGKSKRAQGHDRGRPTYSRNRGATINCDGPQTPEDLPSLMRYGGGFDFGASIECQTVGCPVRARRFAGPSD
jgi:hypothetical protein